MKKDLEKLGLSLVESCPKTLGELRQSILEHGSAIVTFSKAIGGHVVVVDHVWRDLERVRLRDPYHGWEITVTASAFLKEWVRSNPIMYCDRSAM